MALLRRLMLKTIVDFWYRQWHSIELRVHRRVSSGLRLGNGRKVLVSQRGHNMQGRMGAMGLSKHT